MLCFGSAQVTLVVSTSEIRRAILGRQIAIPCFGDMTPALVFRKRQVIDNIVVTTLYNLVRLCWIADIDHVLTVMVGGRVGVRKGERRVNVWIATSHLLLGPESSRGLCCGRRCVGKRHSFDAVVAALSVDRGLAGEPAAAVRRFHARLDDFVYDGATCAATVAIRKCVGKGQVCADVHGRGEVATAKGQVCVLGKVDAIVLTKAYGELHGHERRNPSGRGRRGTYRSTRRSRVGCCCVCF